MNKYVTAAGTLTRPGRIKKDKNFHPISAAKFPCSVDVCVYVCMHVCVVLYSFELVAYCRLTVENHLINELKMKGKFSRLPYLPNADIYFPSKI